MTGDMLGVIARLTATPQIKTKPLKLRCLASPISESQPITYPHYLQTKDENPNICIFL